MIWELRHEFKLSLLLEIAELPRSTYYYYIKHMKDEDKYNEIVYNLIIPLINQFIPFKQNAEKSAVSIIRKVSIRKQYYYL